MEMRRRRADIGEPFDFKDLGVERALACFLLHQRRGPEGGSSPDL